MITLATLEQATAQEVFDQVKDHLLKQKQRSVDNELNCSYRGKDGLKCAAGCLIADDEYKEDLEGHSWFNLVEQSLVPNKHEKLIRDLQYIHDSQNPDTWEDILMNLAHHLNLEYKN